MGYLGKQTEIGNTVHNKLHRKRGQKHAQKAGCDINARFAQSAFDQRRGQEKGKNGDHDRRDHCIGPQDAFYSRGIAGQQNYRRNRSWSGNQRDCQWKDRWIIAHLFVFAVFTPFGTSFKQHIKRGQKQ